MTAVTFTGNRSQAYAQHGTSHGPVASLEPPQEGLAGLSTTTGHQYGAPEPLLRPFLFDRPTYSCATLAWIFDWPGLLPWRLSGVILAAPISNFFQVLAR